MGRRAGRSGAGVLLNPCIHVLLTEEGDKAEKRKSTTAMHLDERGWGRALENYLPHSMYQYENDHCGVKQKVRDTASDHTAPCLVGAEKVLRTKLPLHQKSTPATGAHLWGDKGCPSAQPNGAHHIVECVRHPLCCHSNTSIPGSGERGLCKSDTPRRQQLMPPSPLPNDIDL